MAVCVLAQPPAQPAPPQLEPAQQGANVPPPTPRPAVPVPPADDGRSDAPRDPTQVDPALQPLLGIGPAAQQVLAPPPVVMRGRAIDRSGKAVALLDIDGRLHVVRPKMRLTLSTTGGAQTLVIKEITSRQVTFELGDTGRTFVAR